NGVKYDQLRWLLHCHTNCLFSGRHRANFIPSAAQNTFERCVICLAALNQNNKVLTHRPVSHPALNRPSSVAGSRIPPPLSVCQPISSVSTCHYKPNTVTGKRISTR